MYLVFGLITYLDQSIAKLWSKYIRYLDRTIAQRIGSASVKSKSEVTHYVANRQKSVIVIKQP